MSMARPTITILTACLAVIVAFPGALAAELTRISDDFYVAGQPTVAELHGFAEQGGLHVIDLRPPSETPDFNEAEAVTRAGMAYYNIPVAGAAGLTRENVELLDRLLVRLEGEKTLLHCSTANRVGALMALRARWLHDASPEEALEVGRAHGLASLRPQVEALLQAD